MKKDPALEASLYGCLYCGGSLDSHHVTTEDYDSVNGLVFVKYYSRKCTRCGKKNLFKVEHLGATPKINAIPPTTKAAPIPNAAFLSNLIQLDDFALELEEMRRN